MASVVISGDTSGTVTLSAPAVAGSNTISLPAQTGDALVDIARSLTTNGYVKLSNGLVIQWGKTASIGTGGSAAVTFPIAFPTNCAVVVSGLEVASGANSFGVSSGVPTTTGVTLYSNGAVAGPHPWIAIGY